MTIVSIGSVSHATMRNEDLIPAFVDALDAIKENLAASITTESTFEETESVKAQITSIDVELAAIEEHQQADDYYESEESDMDLNEVLFDLLNEYAPPYCYFGAHPGDGSDYGFWPSEDLNQAIIDDDGIVVEDTSDVGADFSGPVLHVNDHGNVTLYRATNGELTEVWSIV